MELIDWIVRTLRENPAIAIFLTLGIGFWIGKFKYKNFGLGTVTSVLLVGVLVGQLDIPVGNLLKQVSFLLFLFAIGYSVGPQFFRALRGSGIKQVIFAVVMCVLAFVCTWGVALLFRYNVGEAAGLFAGAQTISAVIGIADDTITNLPVSDADRQAWQQIVPVGYAVTYIFGTIGSAWILGTLGPMMLGGIKKVRKQTADLAREMAQGNEEGDPAMFGAYRPVAYRAYSANGEFFSEPKTIKEIQNKIEQEGRRMFIERLRINGEITDNFTSDTIVNPGDAIVISARREFIVEDESWLGKEIADSALLDFPRERIPVLVARKKVDGMTVGEFRKAKFAEGVIIASINREGQYIPVLPATELHRGDLLTLTGHKTDVETAADALGYADKPTTASDMVFVGLGIAVGAIIGAITFKIGRIPVSLSTSGGALIAGLILGWLRSRRPTFGFIPGPAVWIFNNVGLNLFIAVIGIASGPTFVAGLQQVGWTLLLAGAIATTLPLVIGIFIGDKVFHFHPAINLGCVAGARTTTAALGAIQDSLQSTIPAMGYTVTYAIGNTLLILSGLILIVLM